MLLDFEADAVLDSASIGKLLLLAATARGLSDGTLAPDEPLDRGEVEAVTDSGIWQDLRQPSLALADVAALVGAVSDNLATNVLLDRVSLATVQRMGRELGVEHAELADRVRDVRGPEHAPALSRGSARGWVELLVALSEREELWTHVRAWLTGNCDLSMVAAPLGLDPLSHRGRDRGYDVINKTGSDPGVRADVGILDAERTVAYGVIAQWSAREDRRDEALTHMHHVGEALAAYVAGAEGA